MTLAFEAVDVALCRSILFIPAENFTDCISCLMALARNQTSVKIRSAASGRQCSCEYGPTAATRAPVLELTFYSASHTSPPPPTDTPYTHSLGLLASKGKKNSDTHTNSEVDIVTRRLKPLRQRVFDAESGEGSSVDPGVLVNVLLLGGGGLACVPWST